VAGFMKSVDFSQFLKKLQSATVHDVLVFAYDGFALHGACVHPDGEQGEILAQGRSTHSKLLKAVDEVMTQIRQQKPKGLPKQAVLASVEVFSSPVEAPLSDKVKDKELAGQFSWELESVISDRIQKWSIGVLLEGYGLINSEQRHSIAVDLEIKRQKGAEKTVRFGEVCIESGYIDRDRLNEILVIQERLMTMDGSLDVAWKKPPQVLADEDEELLLAAEKDDSAMWFVAGIFKHNRLQWNDAFRRSGLKLQTIYPLHGLSSSLISLSPQKENEALFVEVFRERFVLVRYRGQEVVAVEHSGYQGEEELFYKVVESVSQSLRPDTEALWLANLVALPKGFVEQLKEKFDLSILLVKHPLSIATSMVYQHDLKPMSFEYQAASFITPAFWVLANKTLISDTQLLPAIAAPEPKPPVWKNRDVWRYSMPVWALLAIGGNEIYMQQQMSSVSQQLESVEKEREELEKLSKQIALMNAQTLKAKKELDEVKAQTEELNQSLFVQQRLQMRNDLINELLVIIQRSVNEYVLIDRLVEAKRLGKNRVRGFELQGWSLRENFAQQFTEELNKNLLPIGFEVPQFKINRGIGRTGVRGYEMNLLLLPKEEIATDEAAEQVDAKGKSAAAKSKEKQG
jgi:hypothetical protein